MSSHGGSMHGGPMSAVKGREYGTTGYSKRKDFSDIPPDFQLPEGNLARGRKYFKKHCLLCHSVYPDGRNMTGTFSMGPTLFDCYMRTSGCEEVGRMSSREVMSTGMGLEEGQTVWTASELMNYMKNPRLALGPNQMNFEGITDFQKRVDIIHYMKTLNYSNPMFQDIQERPSSFPPRRWYEKYKKDKDEQEWKDSGGTKGKPPRNPTTMVRV